MNLNSKSQLAEVPSKRSSGNNIAEEESGVGQARRKCFKPDESSSSKAISNEREPPRFLDVGYNSEKVAKNVDKGKVMLAVTLSARKKTLNDYLNMMLSLKNNELAQESDENSEHLKAYLCCACFVRFRTYKELKNHIERSISRLMWRCSICWLSFETRNICQVVYHAPEYHVNDLGNYPEKIPIELMDVASVCEPIKMKEVCPECRQAVGSIISHLWYSRQKDPGYNCPHCNAFFTRNVCRYNLHVRMHNNTAPYRCPDCAKLFDNCTNLLLHLNKICRHVQQTVRYKCCICDVIFYTEVRLKDHIVSDHNPVKYKCHVCPSEMNITSEKNSHYSEYHSNQLSAAELRRAKSYILSHNCAICGETGFKGHSYERHISKHFSSSFTYKISTFQCNCAFVTIYRATYLCHKSTPCITNYFSSLKNSPALLKLCLKCLDLRYFNGSDPFLCERCEYLDEKYNKRIYYLCLLCKKRITYAMEHVLLHLQKQHKIDLEMAHKHVRKFPHINIDKQNNELELIEDNLVLDEHSAQHHQSNDENTLRCIKCGECFSEKNLLGSHYINKHGENSACLECGHSFNNFNSLSIHLHSHAITNIELYLKRYYGINYSDNGQVNVTRIDNDFICSVCDKLFSTTAMKNQHMRSHGMLFLKNTSEI